MQNSTGVILIKICSKIIFWRPKSCFKRLNPNQNIKKSAAKNLRPNFVSKNLNPDFDLTNFQSPNLPFDITNRQISVSAVHSFFSGSIPVLKSSQTACFVLVFFLIFHDFAASRIKNYPTPQCCTSMKCFVFCFNFLLFIF